MSEIPSSWEWSTIGHVTQYIQRGKSPKYAEQSPLPVINQKCIRWDELQLQHLKYIHPDQFDAWDEPRYIKPGDILWNSTGTGTVGRAYLVKREDTVLPKVVDSHVTIVRPASDLEPRYLFNWIKSPAVQNKIEEMCEGTTNQIELSRTAIAATEIPIAPRAEQTRIADQLDTLLARIKACNDHLDAIPALLKRFRQAVVDAAVTGELLESQLTSEVPMCSLAEVLAEPLRNGKSVRDGAGLPVLRLTSIRGSWIDLTATKTGDWSSVPDWTRFLVEDGDYLVARGNGSKDLVGRGGLVRECKEQIAFPDTMIRIRPDKSALLPSYLQHIWGSRMVREQIERAAKTTAGIWKLSQPDLERIRFPVPSLDSQRALVEKLDELLAFADSVQDRHDVAKRRAMRLSPQTLTKAFRGELVPQDANDESASTLLAKLRAASDGAAAAPFRKRVQTPSERQTMSNADQNSVKAVILKLKPVRFSFDELKAQIAGDYESLKTALFALLEEPNPVIRQVFDEEVKAMRFERVVL